MTDRQGGLPLNHYFQALDSLDRCAFCKVYRRKVTRLAKGAPVRGQSRTKEVDKAEYSEDGEAWSEAFIGCLGRRARDEKRAAAMKVNLRFPEPSAVVPAREAIDVGPPVVRARAVALCPFCHSDKVSVVAVPTGHRVECATCTAQGPVSAADAHQAVRRWNMRGGHEDRR